MPLSVENWVGSCRVVTATLADIRVALQHQIMQTDYSDILDRIPDPPLWWFNGVPRYKPFSPIALSVGSPEAALALVRCQDCATEFTIGVQPNLFVEGSMLEQILSDDFSYGDPPRHAAPDGSRCAGETNGAILINLIEAWGRDQNTFGWHRLPQFEGPMKLSD